MANIPPQTKFYSEEKFMYALCERRRLQQSLMVYKYTYIGYIIFGLFGVIYSIFTQDLCGLGFAIVFFLGIGVIYFVHGIDKAKLNAAVRYIELYVEWSEFHEHLKEDKSN